MRDSGTMDGFTEELTAIYCYAGKFARKYGFDEHTLMDVTQEIVIRSFLRRGTFNGKSKLKTWIFSVARNYCINFKNRVYDNHPFFSDHSRLDSFSSDSDAVPERVMEKEAVEALTYYFKRLPPRLKDPLRYFYYDDLKYDDIAVMLGIPIGTVKSRIFEAKRILRTNLERHFP